MKKTRLIAIMILGLTSVAHSQTLKGRAVDLVDGKPLSGASVTLTSIKDSLRKFNSLADPNGAFQFTGLPKDSFFLKLGFTGYEEFKQIVSAGNTPLEDLGTLLVPRKTTVIGEVIVKGKTAPVQQKGDTSEYNANQFKVNPDATTEDLIKKMPGITVAKDGTVTAQGQTVQKVTVDGRDFFGDDATATLRNLPATIVDKIQVFDRLSDQAQFTGFDDGSGQRSINIVTTSGITNGQFGRIYAGYGSDSRYSGGGNISFFKGNRRLSFVGNFNNINQQNFASQDILGAMSSGGGGGFGGRGGGGGFGGGGGGANFGGGNNFTVGQQSGISKTNAFGINFGDKWGKKLDVQGSYFFNNSNNNNDQQKNRLTNFGNGMQETDQNSVSNTKNTNHRANMRITYTIDPRNSIIIMPNVSFQNNESFTTSLTNTTFNSDSSNFSDVANRSDRNGYNIRNTILYRHSFKKRGRTFSVNLNTGVSKNDAESYANGYYRFFKGGIYDDDSTQNQYTDNQTNGYSVAGNISYTEPIGKKGQLQITYQPSYTKNEADQQTFDYDLLYRKYSAHRPSLSNKFDNTNIIHSGGITYRLGASRDNQLAVGLNAQRTELNSDRIYPGISKVRQDFTNLLPNLMWRKKISPRSSLNIFYRANTNAPSVTELQDILNLSNPLNVSVGNPLLKQTISQVFTGRYTFTNTQKGQSFFANVSLQSAQNYISNVTYRINADTIIQNEKISAGSNLTKPVNVNGYKSIASFFTFSQPIKVIKSNISLSTGFSYSNLPGLVESFGRTLQKTSTKNYSYNAGMVLASNVNEYIDFNLSYNANFSNAKSSIAEESKSVNTSAGIQVNLLSKKGWFLQNDVTNQAISGLAEGYNQTYWLWNAAVGKKFLKKKSAELKLSVFDLLKQNQSITRTVESNYIEDTRSRVLTQYFMLTFTYSLKNFGTPAKRGEGFGPGGFGPGGFGPGGFGPGGNQRGGNGPNF
jgi:hypothetical protein